MALEGDGVAHLLVVAGDGARLLVYVRVELEELPHGEADESATMCA